MSKTPLLLLIRLDYPPAKKRRGLAGSIVSTALSAAVIGTAVGLTVYRLWRDRGKAPEQTQNAPPPYDQGDWIPSSPSQTHTAPSKPSINVLPATPSSSHGRRVRQHAHTSHHNTASRRRKQQRARAGYHSPTSGGSSSGAGSAFFPPVTEFSFGAEPAGDDDDAMDDQMDWIGGKLSMLIEEGKKALGKEVVVLSESREDEVDDGEGAWEEDDAGEFGQTTRSRSSSVGGGGKRRKNNTITLGRSPYSNRTSPRNAYFDIPSSSSNTNPMAIPSHNNSFPNFAGASSTVSSSLREDASSWQSKEMKELMERARANAAARRGP